MKGSIGASCGATSRAEQLSKRHLIQLVGLASLKPFWALLKRTFQFPPSFCTPAPIHLMASLLELITFPTPWKPVALRGLQGGQKVLEPLLQVLVVGRLGGWAYGEVYGQLRMLAQP
eukprot:3909818-Pyramimonas_sp.AAC.1